MKWQCCVVFVGHNKKMIYVIIGQYFLLYLKNYFSWTTNRYKKLFFSGFTYIIFLRRKYNPGNHIFVHLCSSLLCEINALGLYENNLWKWVPCHYAFFFIFSLSSFVQCSYVSSDTISQRWSTMAHVMAISK